jgi:DNA replication protein DnaC
MAKTKQRSDVPDDPERLRELLVELNLTGAAENLDALLRKAQQDAYSYSRFLTALLRVESQGRFQRKLSRALKRSHLGVCKSLDEFDFSIRRKLPAPAVKELLNCQWIDEGRCVLCVGRSGTGKTHVAKALGHAACMKGYSVLYMTTAQLLDELHASLADNTYRKVFRRYAGAQLLICDELGYLPLDRGKADYLFRLVSARHPERSMIVAANTGLDDWGAFFPSKAQGIATMDRLIDRATILRFTGKTCRKPKDIHGDALSGDE